MEPTTLQELYRSIDPEVSRIYVIPRIERSSETNPYLSLLYKDFLRDGGCGSISIVSPHPLFPSFLFRRLAGERSIVHYHWVEFIDCAGLIIVLWKFAHILLYKLCGGAIVWSVHNKHCHAKRFLAGNLLLRSIIARVATKLHVHCGEAVGIMAPLLKVPEQKFTVIPHPRYPVTHIDAREARSFCTRHLVPNLAAGKPVFLMYGNIGAYKGCIECVPLIPPSAQLIIAGAVKKHEDRYLSTLRELIRTRDNIHLIPRFVTAEEEANLFNAADCVLFNFTDTLTSGSVILALSYGKRILAPAVGCCRELAAEHAMIFQTQDELRDCIRKFIHHPAEQ